MLIITYNEDAIKKISSGLVLNPKLTVTDLALGDDAGLDFLVFNGPAANFKVNKDFISFTHTNGISSGGNNANLIEVEFMYNQLEQNPIEEFLIKSGSREFYRKYKEEVDRLDGTALPTFNKNTLNNPYIYVLYGHEGKVSGPHKCVLQSVNFYADEGTQASMVKIALTPQAREIGDGGFIRRLNSKSSVKPTKVQIEGKSKAINVEPLVNPKATQPIYSVKDRGIPSDPYTPPPGLDFDFHLILKDTIRSYLRSVVGHKNVIVLLPNINEVCSDKIVQYYKNTTFGYRGQPVDKSLPFVEATLEAEKDAAATAVGDPFLQNTYVLRSFAEQFGLDFIEEKRIGGGDRRETTSEAERRIRDIGPDEFDPRPLMPKKSTVERFGSYYKEATGGDAGVVSYTDKFFKHLENTYFRMHLSDAIYHNEDGVVTYSGLEKLKTVCNNISKLSGFAFSFQLFTETNTDFQEVFTSEELVPSDLLGTDNSNPSGGENIVIFGERSLVNNYIYGLGDISKFKNPNFIHPVDRAILENEDFREKKEEKIGKLNFFPMFSFDKDGDNNKFQISKVRINDNSSYRSAIDVVSRKVNNQIVVGLASETLLTFLVGGGGADPQASVRELVEKVYNLYQGDVTGVNEFFDDQIDELSKTDVFNFKKGEVGEDIILTNQALIKEIITEVTTTLTAPVTDTKLVFYFDNNLVLKEDEVKATLLNEFNNLQLSLSIETAHPQFQLGNFYSIGKQAKVILDRLPGSDGPIALPKNYFIVGYTHRMSGQQLTSEFELVRQR